MRSKLLVVAAIMAGSLILKAQTGPNDLKPMLQQEIQPVSVVAYQLSQYLTARIPKLPSPSSAEQWTSEQKRWREHVLKDIVFHGWPRAWVDAAPKFEDLGVFETGHGYRWHKLRFEIVPGFNSTAILYEPEHMAGQVAGDPERQRARPAGKCRRVQAEALPSISPSAASWRSAWNGWVLANSTCRRMRTTSARTWIWWVPMSWACFIWRCGEAGLSRLASAGGLRPARRHGSIRGRLANHRSERARREGQGGGRGGRLRLSRIEPHPPGGHG